MKTLFAKGFGVSGLAALVLFGAVDADAATRGFSPIECVNAPGSLSHSLESGQIVNRQLSNITEYCPVVSDSTISARNASSADIWVWSQRRGSVSFQPCRTSRTGGAGVCIGGNGSINTGAVERIFASTGAAWGATGSSDADGYYLVVTMEPNTALFSYDFQTPQ